MTEDGAENEPAPPREESKLYIGQNGPSVWREEMQIGNPMSEGLRACRIFSPCRKTYLTAPLLSSDRLQSRPVSDSSRVEGCLALQFGRPSHPCHRACLEHAREP